MDSSLFLGFKTRMAKDKDQGRLWVWYYGQNHVNCLIMLQGVVGAHSCMPACVKLSSVKCFAGNFLDKAKPKCLESEILLFPSLIK